jgi:hypothetical protein
MVGQQYWPQENMAYHLAMSVFSMVRNLTCFYFKSNKKRPQGRMA